MLRQLFFAVVLTSSLMIAGASGTATAAEDDANIEIESIDVGGEELKPGETLSITAHVDNEEWDTQRFFVGLTVEGPNGDHYDNRDSTGHVVELDGETEQDVELSFEVPEDAPEGEYDVIVATWAETDRDDLVTRLDGDREYDSFSVEQNEDSTERNEWSANDDTDDGTTYQPPDDPVGDTEVHTITLDRKKASVGLVDVVSKSYTESASIPATVIVSNLLDEDKEYVVELQVRGPDGKWRYAATERVSLDANGNQYLQLRWNLKYDAPTGQYDARAVVREANFFGNGEEIVATSSTTRNAFGLVTYDETERCKEAISTWEGVQGSELPIIFNVGPTLEIKENCYN